MESIKSLYKNNKQVFITYLVSTIIGINIIPIIVIFNQFDILDISKIMNYKTYISLNIIFLLGLIVYKLICSNKKSMNILLLWCYLHLSSSIFLIFSGIIEYSNLYSVISGFNISSVSYFVLSTVAIFYFNYLIKKEKNCSKNKEPKTIYESRKDKAGYLTKLLTAKEKNMILIDGEWGIGKSYFVDSVVEKIEEYHKIFVDVLLFSDKEQLINHTLNEINTVLVNAGIRNNSLRKYRGILKVISESSPIKFGHFLENDSLEIIEKNIENDLEKLGKPIYIIVDNLERVLDKRKIIDILGFLHKVYEISSNKTKIKIMTLADSTKILGLENIPSDYLDKFFTEKVYLVKVEKNEILNSLIKFIKEENSKFQERIDIESFIEAFASFEKIKESIFRLHGYEREFINYCRKRILDMDNALKNPRNIEKIISDSLREVNNYNYIFKDSENLQKRIFIIQIILSNVYLKFSQSNDSIFLNRETICNFYNNNKKNVDRPRLKEDEFEEVFLLEYLSSYMEQNMYYEENELYIISFGFYKIIKRIIDFEEEVMLKQMKDILENENFPEDYRDKNEEILINFNEYISYYSSNQEESLKIFENILNNCLGTTDLNIKNLFNVLRNKKFLEINKQYFIKYGKSILDSFSSFYEWRIPILNSLHEAFLLEFYYLAKNYLDYEKNIENLNYKDFFEELPSLYWKKFNTKHIRLAEIVREVLNSDKLFDEFIIVEMKIYNKLSRNLEEDNVLFVPYFNNIKKIQNETVNIANFKELGYTYENIRKIYVIGRNIKKYISEDFNMFFEYFLDINSKKYIDDNFFKVFNENLKKYIENISYEFYKHIIERIVYMNNNLSLEFKVISYLLFKNNEKSFDENLNELKNLKPSKDEYGDNTDNIINIIKIIIFELKERLIQYDKQTKQVFLNSFVIHIERNTFVFETIERRIIIELIKESFDIVIN